MYLALGIKLSTLLGVNDGLVIGTTLGDKPGCYNNGINDNMLLGTTLVGDELG